MSSEIECLSQKTRRAKNKLAFKEVILKNPNYLSEHTKICSKCKKEKILTDFNLDFTQNDFARSDCKQCRYEFRGKNKEKIIQQERKYRELKKQANLTSPKPLENKSKKFTNTIKFLLQSAQKRAKEKNYEFDLDENDISIPNFCPVLGIKIELNNEVTMPSSPSLDRINNDKGYVKGNVRVISHRANSLKSNATYEELKFVCEDSLRLLKSQVNNVTFNIISS